MKGLNGLFDKHSQEFTEYMIRLKAMSSALQRKVDEAEDIQQSNLAKKELINASYQRQVANESKVEGRLLEIESVLSNAQSKENSAKDIYADNESRQKNLDRDFELLIRQREDLNDKQRELDELEVELTYAERKIRSERRYIDRMKDDIKLKKELGE